MDWNWFFSSVAQSVAALVGVIGAFLISRILNNEGAYARNRARTRELLRRSDELTDRVRTRYFHWYNERSLVSSLQSVTYALRKEDSLRPAEEYYDEFHFSPYIPGEEVLAAIRERISSEEDRRKRSRNTLQLPEIDPGLLSSARERLEDEGEAIAQVVLAIKAHLREVAEHLESIEKHPERSRVVRITLAVILALFAIGVVYPLTLLPVAQDGLPAPSLSAFSDHLSTKALILWAASVLFAGLVVFLGILNERLTHPVEDLVSLRNRLEVESYSEYLRIRVDNGIPLYANVLVPRPSAIRWRWSTLSNPCRRSSESHSARPLGAILVANSPALTGQDTTKAVFPAHRTVLLHTGHPAPGPGESPRQPRRAA